MSFGRPALAGRESTAAMHVPEFPKQLFGLRDCRQVCVLFASVRHLQGAHVFGRAVASQKRRPSWGLQGPEAFEQLHGCEPHATSTYHRVQIAQSRPYSYTLGPWASPEAPWPWRWVHADRSVPRQCLTCSTPVTCSQEFAL